MYRWPLTLHPAGLYDPPNATLEISPRALGFALLALAEAGHAAYGALLDAYLRGEVRFRDVSNHVELGYDSADIAAHLAAPLLLAHELGWELLDLRDVILLPPTRTPDYDDREERGLLFAPHRRPLWVIVTPGDLIGFGSRPEKWTGWRAMDRPGHAEAFIRLPDSDVVERWRRGHGTRPSLLAAVSALEPPPPARIDGDRLPPNAEELAGAATCAVSAGLRRLALGRVACSPRVQQEAAGALLREIEARQTEWTERQFDWLRRVWRALLLEAEGSSGADFGALPASTVDAYVALGERADALGLDRPSRRLLEGGAGTFRPPRIFIEPIGTVTAGHVSVALGPALDGSRFADGGLEHDGLAIDVAMVPEADGGVTLSLLPPPDEPAVPNLVVRMEAAARAVLVGLMGMPFAEERKEVIEHRLIGPERTTTLLVGWSLVLPRNRRVFAAWLGSDGRVMIRLFPPEGQRARGRL